MRENTPPRIPDIEDEIEVIDLDDIAPDFMDDEDLDIEDMDESNGDEESVDDYDDVFVQDDALITFQKHTKSIFTCDFHPNKEYCVTGGEDDKAIVWNRSNGQILQEFIEHKDTVIEARFNHDGTYLATADMAGAIFLRKQRLNENKDVYWENVWEMTIGDMSWMHWHNKANVLFAGCETGDLYVIRVPSGEYKTLPSNGSSCVSGDLCADGKTYFASYDDGTVKLWDIKSCTVLMQIDSNKPIKHTGNQTMVACDKNGPFYMSGDEGGKIIFSTTSGPVGMVETIGPIECLAFSPSSDIRMAASGTLNGQIDIWDSNKLALRTTCKHTECEKITKLQWISDFTLLVGTSDGNVYGYDGRTGVKIFKLSGHKSFIYTFTYDDQSRQLLTVSDDQSAKIFQIPFLAL